MLKNYTIVFLGGMVGATLRFLVQSLTNTYLMLWIANLIGSFLLGTLNGVFNKKENESLKLFLTTGMLGAFTTFSTFSEEWFFQLRENVMVGILFGTIMTVSCFLVSFLGYRIVQGDR